VGIKKEVTIYEKNNKVKKAPKIEAPTTAQRLQSVQLNVLNDWS